MASEISLIILTCLCKMVSSWWWMLYAIFSALQWMKCSRHQRGGEELQRTQERRFTWNTNHLRSFRDINWSLGCWLVVTCVRKPIRDTSRISVELRHQYRVCWLFVRQGRELSTWKRIVCLFCLLRHVHFSRIINEYKTFLVISPPIPEYRSNKPRLYPLPSSSSFKNVNVTPWGKISVSKVAD